MNVTSTSDNALCVQTLDALGVLTVFQPTPPQVVCDGICQVAPDAWIVGTNDRGRYSIHILQEATKDDAWRFFEELRGKGTPYVASRMTFLGRADNAMNN